MGAVNRKLSHPWHVPGVRAHPATLSAQIRMYDEPDFSTVNNGAQGGGWFGGGAIIARQDGSRGVRLMLLDAASLRTGWVLADWVRVAPW